MNSSFLLEELSKNFRESFKGGGSKPEEDTEMGQSTTAAPSISRNSPKTTTAAPKETFTNDWVSRHHNRVQLRHPNTATAIDPKRRSMFTKRSSQRLSSLFGIKEAKNDVPPPPPLEFVLFQSTDQFIEANDNFGEILSQRMFNRQSCCYGKQSSSVNAPVASAAQSSPPPPVIVTSPAATATANDNDDDSGGGGLRRRLSAETNNHTSSNKGGLMQFSTSLTTKRSISSTSTTPIDGDVKEPSTACTSLASTIPIGVEEEDSSLVCVEEEEAGSGGTAGGDFLVAVDVCAAVTHGHFAKLRWIDNMNAKASVNSALSVFYAMVITIFALVFELAHLLGGETRRAVSMKDLIFGLYMYGVSILFLLYCYVALLMDPQWQISIERLKLFVLFNSSSKSTKSTTNGTIQQSSETSIAMATSHRKVTHDSPSAGSLFLRMGCVVFGLIGMVFYAFSVFLCASDDHCDRKTIILDMLAISFVFIQMHFIFCNWKLSITGSQTIARFGTMHLVAANLWTWIRYILLEESVMDEEIRQVFASDTSNTGSTSPNNPILSTTNVDDGTVSKQRVFTLITSTSGTMIRKCEGAECVLASMSEIMYTSIVEYSLIGAAVMFIVWRNIDHEKVTSAYVKRKHQIRMDCSKSTTGLFIGLAFLAATFTSMAVFSGYTLTGQPQMAAIVFGSTDIGQYVVATIGCACALWQMRLLRYHTPPSIEICSSSESNSGESTANRSTMGSGSGNGHNSSQELLDMILLALGMSGEMIYSVAGLLGLSGDWNSWHPLSIMLLVVHITRIGQVGLQSCLIYIAAKLRIQGDPELRRTQPGKQAITFLLLANVSMFLMNLLEAEKAGISETVVNFYGKKSWVFLVRSFSPLTIFYRFHSSVCLAEVWKNAYSWKEQSL